MFGWWKRRKQSASEATAAVNAGATEKTAAKTGDDGETALPRYKYLIGLHTDVGCVRAGNEDNGHWMEAPDGAESHGTLVLVADGMGGHASGEVASQIAVETVCREYYESQADPETALRKALETANREIHDAARKDASKKGMGTTGTALALLNGFAISAHVGDSRLYLIRGGGIYLMSEDHSAVMELVRQGLLTADEARHHENKNLITRALGLHANVEVSTWKEPFPLLDGDRFLVCSDGLYDLVEDEEILESVLRSAPEQSCIELIDLAKQRGGHDNITVAVVHIEPMSEPTDIPVTAEVKILTEDEPSKDSTLPENNFSAIEEAPETREAETIS